MSEQRSRRDFLRTAALTGIGVWAADKSWAADKTTQGGKILGANDKIKFARSFKIYPLMFLIISSS